MVAVIQLHGNNHSPIAAAQYSYKYQKFKFKFLGIRDDHLKYKKTLAYQVIAENEEVFIP